MRKAIHIFVVLSVLLVSGCTSQPSVGNGDQYQVQNTNPVYFSLGYAVPPYAVVNEPYSHSYSDQFNPSGGNPPYHFQLDSGTGFPPMGLALNPDGTVTGTPTVVGNVSFRVCAVDQSGTQACDDTYIDVKDVYATFDSVSCARWMEDNGIVAGYLVTATGTAKGDQYMSLRYSDTVFDLANTDHGIGYVSTQEKGSTCDGWDGSAMGTCWNDVGDGSAISWTFIFKTFLHSDTRTFNARVAMYSGNQITKSIEKQVTCP
jgi:hypothetical protein